MHTASLPALVTVFCGFQQVMAHGSHPHSHRLVRRSPKTEAVKRATDHDLHALFKRQSTTYPPQDQIGPTPQPIWLETYQKVKSQGFIPGFSNSTSVDAWPEYPTGINPADPAICNFALAKCSVPDDIVNAPDGFAGLAYDDGPQEPTPEMLTFLKENNLPSTHFVIGSRIAENPEIFQQILQIDGHIGCHTWSHPLMSTLTDEQILGELGWTMQIIYDQSGFLPSFWRPPYGDVDNRVRAIAQHVFGMVTTLWNQDSDDWCLMDSGADACPNQGPHTDQGLLNQLTAWFGGSQSPGLIVLEHEHHNRAIQGFKQAYPTLQKAGWKVHNIPDLFNVAWYANAQDNSSKPIPMSIGVGQVSGSLSAGNTEPASQTASLSTSTASSTSSAQSPTGTLQRQSLTAGWSHLSRTVQNVVIGAAIGGAVLLFAIIAICCVRRKRKNSTAAFVKRKNNRSSVLVNLAEKRTSLFEKPNTHPYDQLDISASSQDRLVPEYNPTLGAQHRNFSNTSAGSIRTVPQQNRLFESERNHSRNDLLMPQASNTGLRQSVAPSVYSQDGHFDPFASPPPPVPSMPAAGPIRKSGFHRPNRDKASPYDVAPANRQSNWI